jgi:3-oxoacyl-[acyl-carrier protein] reductase
VSAFAPVTLITGTSRGIGRHLRDFYLARGHRVIGCSRKGCDDSPEGYEHFELDVTDEKAVVALFREVAKRYGRLDHLINNAGIAAMNHFLLTPVSTFERLLQTNLVATFHFCQEAGRLMQRKKIGGRIVNFSTVAVPFALEGEAAYVASKAGVVGLTQVLARELGPYGITVNAVGPTPIETDLIRAVPQDKIQSLLRRQAISRLGTFGDVANVVDFFLRPESEFVSGQTVYLGGVA